MVGAREWEMGWPKRNALLMVLEVGSESGDEPWW